MRYTHKQAVIIQAIAKFQKAGHSQIDLDDICVAVKEELDPQDNLVNFRSGIGACLRDLERKLAYDGLELSSNNMVGRGNKLAFTISGDYTALVNNMNEAAPA